MAQIHIVEQGEHLPSIANDFGFSDWQTIYNHPQNAELKNKRPDPNVLLPGDQVFIPDFLEKAQSCSTDQTHKFVLSLPKTRFKVTLRDAAGNPIKKQRYTLKFADGPTKRGSTNGSGLLQQDVPVGLEDATLTLDKLNVQWVLKIGHLDPIQEEAEDSAIITGLQARLNNLGFSCGSVDGLFGPKTRAALRLFQIEILGRSADQATGEPDKESRDTLKERHGC